MADVKITALTALATVATDDVLPIVDTSAGSTKKITWSNLIADGIITAPKLATNAITLGYTQKTTDFSSTSTSWVQVTDLTVTVTIPAGGRKVEITVWCGSVGSTTGASTPSIGIWDGAVGSGTLLTYGSNTSSAANDRGVVHVSAIVTPAAGSKTYNAGFITDVQTIMMGATSDRPMYIMVKAI